MKRSGGMTVIEVLIAIVIVGIVLSAMFTGITFASKYARHNANKTMALNYAQGLMEEIRGVSYLDLDDYNGDTDDVFLYQGGDVEDVDITAERSVEVADVTIDTLSYKTIKVIVSWDWQGKSYTEEINTLRGDY